MKFGKFHKDSQKRINNENLIYFITSNTFKRYPYFEDSYLAEIWMKELILCKEIHKFKLYGFALMYDHFHLLIKPNYEIGNHSKIMQFLKRHVSRNINIAMGCSDGALKNYNLTGDNEGDNGHCRLHYRYYQPKAKIDKFANELDILKENMPNIYPKFKWQKSFHDHYIRNHNDFTKHLTYINSNHLKHNLPVDWKYVSSDFNLEDKRSNVNNIYDIIDYFY
ncbi:MAG: transposase [Candidatus Dojkabacteria bacterium]|nr:transposase [Candidatus Dojkabacteria bacterium]MDQ7021480.1 transposase [Candidatus Dojkabacteria bacterium]